MSQYATISDLTLSGLPPKALTGLTVDQQNACLQRASGIMDGYFARYTLPLLVWGDDIRQNCIDLADYLAMKLRGFNPQAGPDALIVKGHDDAVLWLRDVSAQKVNPVVTDSGVPANHVSAPQITSQRPQGWDLLNGTQRRGTWPGFR